MAVPRRPFRGRGRHKQHRAVAKEFLIKLEQLLERGIGGEELLPAADYLETQAGIKLSATARKKAKEMHVGEAHALKMLTALENDLASGPDAVSKLEAAKIRVHLEEKVRGL